ncbi:uncharacterized protein SPPG_02882 [Spizellomyces punctatus DAOM BR117]|uniref:Protein DOM34 homolog n=1 Tax=Spizellomyces punctatus (strain DAOM BR117) TaxID=645134 RepID=A0A0L0HLV4_SPIPD|nr:uncharacterized protein SPPG_02882 [Spizellomyces punctatus DAOM BR117]KND02416.1 hypothetical protein SPPG_02882 [Spizellomyces punctatus DAOM BR117]|eukprot:XP_016610455.1 hypothetical protein SPPG_02882 [Spizellomyces punctatus DAOM BR117]
MKLIHKHIEKDRSGQVTLLPEEAEDMWHAYNLIAKDDYLKSTTIRRVVSETATGSTDKSTVRTVLTIRVEEVDFDTQACMLRVSGRNVVENKFVKMGAYHTIDLELNRNFTLAKVEWDVISLERIDDACNIANRADVAAVVLQEGLANLCLVTQNMTIVRQRIETNIPRKRKGSTTNHDKGMTRFFEQVYQAILRHVNFDIVKVLIISSPGFVKDALYQYIFATAIRTDNKTILENRSKFLLVYCSSGQKHALTEVLQQPSVQSQLSDTKYATEVRSLDRFYQMLANDPDRAFYGFKHVCLAAERGAVDTLMVTDELFRSADIPTRRKYIALVEQVRSTGGSVLIFSSLHTSGEQLNQLTGVAATLHFPLPDIEEIAEEEEEAARRAADGNVDEDLENDFVDRDLTTAV